VVTLINKELIQKLRSYFQPQEDVIAVYLFGSTVKGKNRMDSDLDLAVLFHPTQDKIQCFKAKLAITNDLEEIIEKKIDIVDIGRADLFFVHQIMKSKLLIVDKDVHYRVQFEVGYRKNFFDRQKFYRLYQGQALKRLKGRS
jgi:predicted nucleotidyltransferase